MLISYFSLFLASEIDLLTQGLFLPCQVSGSITEFMLSFLCCSAVCYCCLSMVRFTMKFNLLFSFCAALQIVQQKLFMYEVIICPCIAFWMSFCLNSGSSNAC